MCALERLAVGDDVTLVVGFRLAWRYG